MPFPANPVPGQVHTEDNTTYIYGGLLNGWWRQAVSSGNDSTFPPSGALTSQVTQPRLSIAAVAGTYTIDVARANEFRCAAAINGATTINLSNLTSIPPNTLWRGVLSFTYTSGTITWFAGNAGFTVKWDGGSALTPTAGEVETVVITVVGGTNTIEVAALRGRA